MHAHSSLLLGEAVDVPVYSLNQIARATLTRCRSATYCIGVVDIDDCSSALCLNGATCIDGVASYTCICPPGKSGIACEIGNDDRVNSWVWFCIDFVFKMNSCKTPMVCVQQMWMSARLLHV